MNSSEVAALQECFHTPRLTRMHSAPSLAQMKFSKTVSSSRRKSRKCVAERRRLPLLAHFTCRFRSLRVCWKLRRVLCLVCAQGSLRGAFQRPEKDHERAAQR